MAKKVEKVKRGVGAKERGKKEFASSLASDAQLLLRWYDKHRRILPWRALAGQKTNPYSIWLSEIMLQQTTVATVGPYFQKFIKRWPTLGDLAQASLDDVLRMWAGLGYYRRAHMLHQCAQVLHHDYNGVFPRDEKTLLTLPGFGPYTAAAVAAIAFDRRANVVDGNVERVMARVFAITQSLPSAKLMLRAAALPLVPLKRAGDYAQALMDLGATICTPRAPKCNLCPWQKNCRAHALGIQETLPRRAKRAIKSVRRAFAFVTRDQQGRIYLRPRPAHGLLAGMMEVPSTPWLEQDFPTLAKASPRAPLKTKWQIVPGIVTHIFSHFTFEITVATAVITSDQVRQIKGNSGIWIAPGRLSAEALPSVMKKIVQHALKAIE